MKLIKKEKGKSKTAGKVTNALSRDAHFSTPPDGGEEVVLDLKVEASCEEVADHAAPIC